MSFSFSSTFNAQLLANFELKLEPLFVAVYLIELTPSCTRSFKFVNPRTISQGARTYVCQYCKGSTTAFTIAQSAISLLSTWINLGRSTCSSLTRNTWPKYHLNCADLSLEGSAPSAFVEAMQIRSTGYSIDQSPPRSTLESFFHSKASDRFIGQAVLTSPQIVQW